MAGNLSRWRGAWDKSKRLELTPPSAPVCFLPGGGPWKGRGERTKEQKCSAEQLQGQESLAGWFWIVVVLQPQGQPRWTQRSTPRGTP